MEAWIEPYLAFLQQVVTPFRLRHSLGVMQVMDELADLYHLDHRQALLAGLLHDAAKDLSPEQQAQIIVEAGLSHKEPWEQDYPNYLHGPVGAIFVRQQLGLDDPLVLDAIAMHTFCGCGGNFECPLVWCLRFSDLLEPYRNWNEHARRIREGLPRLREMVFNSRFEEAAFFQTGVIIRFFEENGVPIHPNLRLIYQNRSTQLGLGEAWFGFE